MMPENEIIFKISGSALSFLYYQCDKSRMDQVGFLIGEKHLFVKKTISDAQMNGERNETIINICAVLPVGTPFMFSNNGCRINKTMLKGFLGHLEKDVCGWYIFRRNSGLDPLLRGTMIHRGLLDALPHVTPESFVLCCVGSDASQSRSTHRFRHVFLLHKNRLFEPVSVPIINLGQSEDVSYRTVAVTTSCNTSFSNIASSVRLDNNSGGLAALKALQKPLQEKIMKIAVEVQKYDEKTQKLVSEIQELKNINSMTKHQNEKCSEREVRHGELIKVAEVEVEKNVLEVQKEKDIKEISEDKNSEDSEEIVVSSQKITSSNIKISKTESSPTSDSGDTSMNCEKNDVEELLSNSQDFTPSQEY